MGRAGFKLLCLQNPFTPRPSALIIIKKHISKLRITFISPLHVTQSCTLGRTAFVCNYVFFLVFLVDSLEMQSGVVVGAQMEKPVR